MSTSSPLPPFGPLYLTLSPRRIHLGSFFRLIPGAVWWQLVYIPWRRYLAAVSTATLGISPPTLAPPGQNVYLTDQESLQGLVSPADFAMRLSLRARDHTECQLYGCAIIELTLPTGTIYTLPYPGPGATPGLTAGGAREWLSTTNIDLASGMHVTYVENDRGRPRFFRFTI